MLQDRISDRNKSVQKDLQKRIQICERLSWIDIIPLLQLVDFNFLNKIRTSKMVIEIK